MTHQNASETALDPSPWLGLPYQDRGRTREGLDCWGLVALVLAALGRPVPRYDDTYISAEDRHEIAALITRRQSAWQPVAWADRAVGDVVILALADQPFHCGLLSCTQPPRLLHAAPGLGTVVEPLDRGRWAGRVHRLLRWDEASDR